MTEADQLEATKVINQIGEICPNVFDFIFSLYWYPRITKYEFVDADTIRIWFDLGFHLQCVEVTFRLNRIDAWENRGDEKALGLAATEAIKRFVDDGRLIAQTVKDRKGFDAVGKFGRLLVELYLLKDGLLVNLNDWLVEQGHAEYKSYRSLDE